MATKQFFEKPLLIFSPKKAAKAPKNNTTVLDYSAFHNFKKLEPFINVGLRLVFQKMSKKYITELYLKETVCKCCFFFWRIIVSIFFLVGINAKNYGKANN